MLTRQKEKETNRYRLRQGVYDWNSDFPVILQDREPMGKTRLTLTFELNEDECAQFKKETGSKTNQQLPIVMEVDDATVLFKVSKSGRGASNYSKSAPQIARFISSRFGFQYIPAIRPAELSLDLINNLIDSELSKLESDPEYTTAMNVISSLQQPILHRIELDVKQSLNQLLPSVKDVKINFDVRGGMFRSRLRNRTARFIIDDGVPTDIESKGDGIKSLAAIALMRSVNLNLAERDSLVAIEEPESHLHPEAVRQLAYILEDIAQEHQVIVTSHSPLLVTRSNAGINIIVEGSSVRRAGGFKDIRESLGVSVADNLVSAEYVLLVEGVTDEKILSRLFTEYNDSLKSAVHQKRLVFTPMKGATKVLYHIYLYRSMAAVPIVIVDDDTQGRYCYQEAAGLGGVAPKYLFKLTRKGMRESEIEDFVKVDQYQAHIESRYGVIVPSTFDKSPTKKWSERMKRLFNDKGKDWSLEIEDSIKSYIANHVEEHGMSALYDFAKDVFGEIAQALASAVSNESESMEKVS